jgi:sulfur carrier protein
MNLVINGEDKNFDDTYSIKDIIQDLKIEGKVMATAVNMNIIKKDNWSSFVPKNNDKIELLQFVGGG